MSSVPRFRKWTKPELPHIDPNPAWAMARIVIMVDLALHPIEVTQRDLETAVTTFLADFPRRTVAATE
jgi:hypothetical protein